MKNRESVWKRQRNTWRIMLWVLALSAVTALSACSSDPGGGIIGTGIINGTVPTKRAFANSDIQIKAQSGQRTSTQIAATGRFEATNLTGQGPYLMRVDLGNANSYYGIAHLVDGASVTQNIHAYSDVALRNWFATQGLDIDAVFENDGAIASLPTQMQINAINANIRALVALSLDAYGLSNVDLQTVSFESNDEGVDQFLDRNTVLVNNGTITIIISEPETGTLGTVSSDLPINTDLTSIDVIPPGAPTGLRVLPSAMNEIVLAWDSATDNIGVTEYEIYRDGVVVATTPYPAYIDTNIASNTTFGYEIVALDAAGNASMRSPAGFSQTLAAADETPPPIPTAVQLTPTTASIRVRWTQADVGDVASFRILRSEGNAMIDFLARVTSTEFIDVDLNSGVEYCYQVIALDASQNPSDASDIGCTSTSGEVVGTPSTPTTPPIVSPPGDPSGNGASYLLAVDVSSTACTDEVDFTSVDSDITLSGSCFLVNNSITVQSGSNLTIAPGTVLKFAAGTGVRVSQGGSLTAAGTTTDPIVLTGQDRTPGYWEGLRFVFSNSSSNRLENVLIEYGGQTGSDDAAVSLIGSVSLITRIAMTNVLLRHSASDGFHIDPGAILTAFDGVISTDNDRSGSVTPELAGDLRASASYTGNNNDEVHVENGDIDNITVWPTLNVPWSVGNLDVDAPLSIGAGSTLRFRSGGGINISSDGSLKAVGTAAQPILFTAEEATPGFWDGLRYVFSGSANNQLQHVTVEYGGDGSNNHANIHTASGPTLIVRLSMNNVTLRNGVGPGFRFDEGTILTSFNNITVSGNDSSGVIHPSQLIGFGNGLDFTGNTIDEIVFRRMTVESAQTWPAVNVPYRIDDITIEAPLTLEPGITMIAMSGTKIRVSSNGSLNAVGTPTQPITMMGEERTAGNWDGIEFVFSNSPQNVLDNVILSDAGAGTVTRSGNISLNCSGGGGGLPSQLTIRNSAINNSASWGIFRDDTDCTVNLGENVTFNGNTQGDINTP
ncbi:MAG: hypothetical protein AB8B87_06775 [Granulosicoccus sp.]